MSDRCTCAATNSIGATSRDYRCAACSDDAEDIKPRHPDRHGPGCGCVGYGPDRLSEVAQIIDKWSCPPLENPANTGLLRELRAALNDQLRGVDPHTQQVDYLTALADRLAGRIARVEALAESTKDFDEVGLGWVSVSEIFAALDEQAAAHDEHHA